MTTLLSRLAALVLTLAAHAQPPCPNPNPSNLPGAWKSRSGYIGAARFSAPRATYDRAAADAALNKLLSILQSAYPDPAGGVAYFTKYPLFSSPDRELPFGYSLYVGHSGFSCTSSNRLVESSESGVFLNLDVNSFSTTNLLSIVTAPEINTTARSRKLNADDEGNYQIGGRLVYRVPAIHDRLHQADRYARTSRANRGGAPTEQFIVLRKYESPLFTYVTRRDYLQQFRAELLTYKQQQMEIDRASSAKPEWQAKFARGMDAYLQAVDAYLRSAPAAELDRPVSELLTYFPIDIDNPKVEFRDGDFHLVRFNSDYLDKKLPLHIPQFIVLRWSIKDTPQPAAWERRFREHFSAKLDLAATRSLF
jgi:hypothetical protein